MQKNTRTSARIGLVTLLLFLSFAAHSEIKIAVLNFELNDLTLAPGTEAELERTASVAPLLRNEFEKKFDYKIMPIDADVQEEADEGFGYLFDHADVSADLCREHGADWILIGRVHKPSFLFAYLKAHLINCETRRPAGDYVIEVKGDAKKFTKKGVENLAIKVNQTLQEKTK